MSTDLIEVDSTSPISTTKPPEPKRPNSRVKHRVIVRAIQVALICVALGLWQYMASGSKTLYLTVSTPWAVMQWIGSWATGGSIPHGRGWPDLELTLEEALLGYLLGVATGITLGAVFGLVGPIQRFFAPFVAMANAFPKIALAPLFILIFGSSLQMKAYFIAAGTFFITFYAVFNGIQSIDSTLLKNARALGASRFWLGREVYVPSIVGWVTSGLRLTIAWSLSAAVIIEFLTANTGMGYVITSGQQDGDVAQALGGLIVISLFALALDRLILFGSRRLGKWRVA